MNASTGSLPEMINSSIAVLTRPSVATFERYERRGGLQQALIYVGAAAAIAGIVGFVFNLGNGIGAALGGLIAAVVGPVIAFLVFATLIYYIGGSKVEQVRRTKCIIRRRCILPRFSQLRARSVLFRSSTAYCCRSRCCLACTKSSLRILPHDRV